MLIRARIGDYALCDDCGIPISRYQQNGGYCKACQKKRKKEQKAAERRRKREEKRQRTELKKNPLHECKCEPQLLTELSRKTYKDGAWKYVCPTYGYYCETDNRTGITVCRECGGIPPKGSSTVITTALKRLY